MSIKSKLLLAAAGLALMCGCKNNSAELPEITTSAAEVTMAKMTELAETTTSKSAEETTAAQTEAEQIDFEYQPPQEVLDTHFYGDDIETEIKWKSIPNDLPEFFTQDMKIYGLKNSEYVQEYADDYGEPDCKFEYMIYDMNDDGLDDYIFKANVYYAWNPDNEYFYKIYLTDEGGSYTPIMWDCVEKFHPTQYILNTKTNGLKDILVLNNKNYPIITFEGDGSYTPCEMLDERHTFFNVEILSSNILHLNMRVSVIDAAVGEYYTAVKFADNTYLKNDMLYSCYSDGTPRSYIEKSIDEWQSSDFNPSGEGYDFYVELTDDGVVAFTEESNVWRLLDLLEIKYIAVDK